KKGCTADERYFALIVSTARNVKSIESCWGGRLWPIPYQIPEIAAQMVTETCRLLFEIWSDQSRALSLTNWVCGHWTLVLDLLAVALCSKVQGLLQTRISLLR